MNEDWQIVVLGLVVISACVLEIIFRRPITRFILREQYRLNGKKPESWRGQRWGILVAGIWGVLFGIALVAIGLTRLLT